MINNDSNKNQLVNDSNHSLRTLVIFSYFPCGTELSKLLLMITAKNHQQQQQQQQQMKPKVVIYLERSSQTELSTEDVQGGQDAAIRLRSLTWQQQHNEEARQLERMLQQVFYRLCVIPRCTPSPILTC